MARTENGIFDNGLLFGSIKRLLPVESAEAVDAEEVVLKRCCCGGRRRAAGTLAADRLATRGASRPVGINKVK